MKLTSVSPVFALLAARKRAALPCVASADVGRAAREVALPVRFLRWRRRAAMAAAVLLGAWCRSPASAQTIMVGQISATQTATVTVGTGGTLGSIALLTQGAPNKDFQFVSGGSCTVGATYAANATCTVNYAFAPTRPGRRMGAVVLESNASTPAPIGTAPISAVGTAPLGTFTTTTAIAGVGSGVGSSVSAPSTVALNGLGDVFVSLEYTNGNDGYICKIVAGTGGNPAGVVSSSSTVVQLRESGAVATFQPVAVDGAGNLFLSVPYYSIVVEYVAGTGGDAPGVVSINSTQVQYQFRYQSSYISADALLFDPSGNLFIGADSEDSVLEVLAGTGGAAPGSINANSTLVAVGSGYYDSRAPNGRCRQPVCRCSVPGLHHRVPRRHRGQCARYLLDEFNPGGLAYGRRSEHPLCAAGCSGR